MNKNKKFMHQTDTFNPVDYLQCALNDDMSIKMQPLVINQKAVYYNHKYPVFIPELYIHGDSYRHWFFDEYPNGRVETIRHSESSSKEVIEIVLYRDFRDTIPAANGFGSHYANEKNLYEELSSATTKAFKAAMKNMGFSVDMQGIDFIKMLPAYFQTEIGYQLCGYTVGELLSTLEKANSCDTSNSNQDNNISNNPKESENLNQSKKASSEEENKVSEEGGREELTKDVQPPDKVQTISEDEGETESTVRSENSLDFGSDSINNYMNNLINNDNTESNKAEPVEAENEQDDSNIASKEKKNTTLDENSDTEVNISEDDIMPEKKEEKRRTNKRTQATMSNASIDSNLSEEELSLVFNFNEGVEVSAALSEYIGMTLKEIMSDKKGRNILNMVLSPVWKGRDKLPEDLYDAIDKLNK